MEQAGVRFEVVSSVSSVLVDGQSVILTGPAGVGKSWTARQVADSLDNSWYVERLSGSPAIQGLAFSGVGHLLPRNAVPAVELLVAAVLEEISNRADGRRVVLLLDDFDQLDVGSVAVCHQFHSQGAQILATVRSGRIEAPAVAAILGRTDVVRRELSPLDEGEVEALLTDELGGPTSPVLANKIWRLSNGNPFVVLSILAELESAERIVQDGKYFDADLAGVDFDHVEAYLGIRLAGLPERTRYALDLVAIAEPLYQEVAIELGVMTELTELEQARLVQAETVGGTSHIRTAHPLIGERLRADMQALRRRDLIGKLANSIASKPESSFSPGFVRIALWAQEVGIELEPKLAERAMLAAFATFDLHATSMLVEQIPEEHRSTDVSVVEAIAAFLQGDVERSERVFQRARESALTEIEMAQAISSRAELLLFAGQQQQAIIDLKAALEEVESVEAKARIVSILAIAAATNGDFSYALGIADELLDQAGLPADIERTLLFTNVIGHALMGPRRDLTRRKQRIQKLVNSDASWFEIEQLEAARATLAVTEAEVNSAVAMIDAAAETADANGRPSGTLTMGRSLLRMMAWRDDGRVGYAEKGLALLSRTDMGGLKPAALACLAHALATVGRVAEASQALEGFSAEPTAGQPRSAVLAGRAQSQIAAIAGDHARSASIILETCQLAADSDHLVWGAMAAHDAVRIGHGVVVMDVLDNFLLATEHCPLVDLLTRHARGVVEGDVELLRSVSNDMELAGLRASAVSALVFASVAAGRHGEEKMENRLALHAHRLLEDDLTTVVPEISQCPKPLSDREHQIAAMASRGATNRQMADELYLSTRTIENHLSRVFKKLGLSSRSELADLLLCNGSVPGP